MISYDMSEKDYHANPHKEPLFSASIAKVLWDKTPYHAWEKHPALNPFYENEHKDCFDFGHAMHALVLENKASNIQIVDHKDWRTNAAKDARKQAYADGKIPLLSKDFYDKAVNMQKAAHDYLKASELGEMPAGNAEVTIIEELESGIPEQPIFVKSRLDFLSKNRKLIIDYKTTKTSANPAEFSKQIPKMGYDIQAELYREMNSKSGGPPAQVVFLVQEDTAPFLCSLVGLAPSMRELGKGKLDHAKALWADCLFKGQWPGYPKRVAYAEAPPWEITKLEDTILSREMEQL